MEFPSIATAAPALALVDIGPAETGRSYQLTGKESTVFSRCVGRCCP